jgi:hypothetical protein
MAGAGDPTAISTYAAKLNLLTQMEAIINRFNHRLDEQEAHIATMEVKPSVPLLPFWHATKQENHPQDCRRNSRR